MIRFFSFLLPLLALVGCQDDTTKDSPSVEEVGGITFWPPEAGRGVTFDARLTAGSSVFSFEKEGLDLGQGVTVNDFTVLDGWTATANVTVAGDAELGARDAEVETGKGTMTLPAALTIVDDSFSITPDRAMIGETVQVEILGANTEWTSGATWANFGEGTEVIGFEVFSETYSVATVSVSHEAVPGLRDVAVEMGPDVTTLYQGFQVDRVALSATFEPTQAYQGDTVEYRITGSGTHFTDNSVVSFWSNGQESPDIVIDSMTVADTQHIYGTMTVSNAAEIGFRDVHVDTYSNDGTEGVVIEDAIEILDAAPDLSNVGISLWFYVVRGIDNTTGDISEGVSGGAIFYLPLDPACPPDPEADCSNGVDDDGDNYTDCYDSDCSSDPSCASGPQPYDVNGVFPTYQTGGTADCPPNETVSAGDYVWFESDCNIVTLAKQVDSSSGMIYYSSDLTITDYCTDQYYDLHTQGDDDAIGEYILEDVQPTVPADFELLTPQLWGNYTHNRNEDFTYTWTPAQTYPDAIFATGISGTLVSTGESGFIGSLPWDDGEHTYTSEELLELEPGNVSFYAYSYIEGPYFGFPFSTIQTNKSSSYIYVSGSMVLE